VLDRRGARGRRFGHPPADRRAISCDVMSQSKTIAEALAEAFAEA
jgi:hypothetical protein